MKIMFISDIHGFKTNLPLVKEKFQEYQCDKLVVLGDLYAINPERQTEPGYDRKYVQEFLDSFQEKMVCVRGNCDSEKVVKESHFPIIPEVGTVQTPKEELYITHGHIYHEGNWEKENTTLIYGHTHIPFIHEKENKTFINPGSISLPLGKEPPSYLLFDGKTFTIYDIFDNILYQKDAEKRLYLKF